MKSWATRGQVVQTGDLSALELAVRELTSSPGRRHELGELGHRRVADKFNPTKSLQQLKEIYASLLSHR